MGGERRGCGGRRGRREGEWVVGGGKRERKIEEEERERGELTTCKVICQCFVIRMKDDCSIYKCATSAFKRGQL